MEFKPGTRVSHPLFGAGVVRAVSGDGPSAKITVDFSPSVGSKKLLASVAKLTSLDGASDCDAGGERPCSAPPAHFSGPTYWVESLDARFEPRGRSAPRGQLIQTLNETVRLESFWSAVREALRPMGFAPRVIDDINEKASFLARASGPAVEIRIRIRHSELLKPDQRILASAVLLTLKNRYLQDFNEPRVAQDFGTQLNLDQAHTIRFEEADLSELPARDPKRTPIREQPKGVIRNRGRSWDDAR